MLQSSYKINRDRSDHDVDMDLLRKHFIKIEYKDSLDKLMRVVCDVTGEEVKGIRGPRKTQEICTARHILIYLLYSLTRATYKQIATTIRDHRPMNTASLISAVLNMSNTIESPMGEHSEKVVGYVTKIIQQLKTELL